MYNGACPPTLEARGAFKTPLSILPYHKHKQNSVAAYLRRSGRWCSELAITCQHANQTSLRDFQLLQV